MQNVDDLAAAPPPTKSSPSAPERTDKASKFQEADLLPFDVLCGRGSNINDYEGNQHYREVILSRRDEYTSLSNKDWNGKNKIAAEIVAAIRGKGGRFLKRVDGCKKKHPVYEYADEEMVSEKTKQALRQKSRKKIKLTLPKPPTFGLGSSKPEAKDKTPRPPCPPASDSKPETAVKKTSHAQSTRRPVENMEFLEFIQTQAGSNGDSRSDPSLPGPLHHQREAFQSKSHGGLPRQPADYPQLLADADYRYQPHPPVLQQPVVNMGQFLDYSHYVATARSGYHNGQPPNHPAHPAINIGDFGIGSRQPPLQQRPSTGMEFVNTSRPIQLVGQPTLQCHQPVESMEIKADNINAKARGRRGRTVVDMEVVNNESQDPDSKDDKLSLSENTPIEDCARLLQHLKKPQSIGGSAGGFSVAESTDAQALTDKASATKSKDDSFALRLEKMSLPTPREDLMSLMSNEFMSAAASTARSKKTCENSFEEKLEGMSIFSMSSGGSRETGTRSNELRTSSGDANSGPIHMDIGNAASATPSTLRRPYNQNRLSHINEMQQHDAQMHMTSYALPAWSGAEYGHTLPSTRIAMPPFPHQLTHPPLGVPSPRSMEAATSFEHRGRRKSLSSYYRETARGVPPQRHYPNC